MVRRNTTGRQRPAALDAEQELRQLQQDINGVERLISMQLTLLKDMQRRLQLMTKHQRTHQT